MVNDHGCPQVKSTFSKGMMRITTTAVGGGLAAIVMNWSVLATNPYYLSLFVLPFDFLVGLGMFTQARRFVRRRTPARICMLACILLSCLIAVSQWSCLHCSSMSSAMLTLVCICCSQFRYSVFLTSSRST